MSNPKVSIFMDYLRILLHKKSIFISGLLFRAVYLLFILFIFYAIAKKEDILVENII